MVKSRGEGDLAHRYRPRRFEEVVGQDSIVQSVRTSVTSDNPSQAFLFTGESGTGKTTMARIVALAVNCLDVGPDREPCLKCDNCQGIVSGRSPDVQEMNAADARGIDTMRELCTNMAFAPMSGKKRVYILDEAHQLTNDAQNTLLKYLEDAPKHVLIILCSTHPTKILKTVKNRCHKFKFTTLARADMVNLVESVVSQEDRSLPSGTLSAVVNASEGAPRNALVALQQVLQLDDVSQENVQTLLSGESEGGNAINLCFTLFAATPSWTKIVDVYDSVKHLGPPALGMTLAGYARNKLLKAKTPEDAEKFHKCLNLFLAPFDTGKLGENQLVSALYSSYKTIRKS